MASFEPTRLKSARRRRGMTQREVADLCDVTSQYISELELEKEKPSSEFIQKVSVALGYPPSFYYERPLDLVKLEALSFRAQSKMTSKTRDTGLGVSDFVANIITPDLLERFRLPAVDVPDLSSYANQPGEAAEMLRSCWGLGSQPIDNMIHLLESKGVRNYWLYHDSRFLDAFSFWHNEMPFSVFNSLKESGERARFDAAHELGHLVLHPGKSELEKKEVEAQANRFASAFLMPFDAFGVDCPDRPDLAMLYRLKPKWKVSVAAMVMRGAEIGIFSDWQKRKVFKQMNALGMRKNEKLRIRREGSKLHNMIFEALEKKDITPAAYAEMLSLSLDDLKEMMPVINERIARKKKADRPLGTNGRGRMKIIIGGKG